MPSVDFGQFIVFFGFYEMVIGISSLFPRLVRLSIHAGHTYGYYHDAAGPFTSNRLDETTHTYA